MRRTLMFVVVIALCGMIPQAGTAANEINRTMETIPQVIQIGEEQPINEYSTNGSAAIEKSWEEVSAHDQEVESLEASDMERKQGPAQQSCCNDSDKAALSGSKSYEYADAAQKSGTGESDSEQVSSLKDGDASFQLQYETSRQATGTPESNNEPMKGSTSRRWPAEYISNEAEQSAALASVDVWDNEDAEVSGGENEHSSFIEQQETCCNETGGVELPISVAYEYESKVQLADDDSSSAAISVQGLQEDRSARPYEMTGAKKEGAAPASVTDTESSLQVASGRGDGRNPEGAVDNETQDQSSNAELGEAIQAENMLSTQERQNPETIQDASDLEHN